MKTFTTALVLGAVLIAVGCNQKKDPRDRPDFVDTTDPSKVMKTMGTLPKSKGGPPSISAGAGTAPGTGAPSKP